MKILFIMPFKISATMWHLTGDCNMSSKILKGITKFPDMEVDVVGNFKTPEGEDCSEWVKDIYGASNCIDLSSVADKRTYIKNGFEVLKSKNIFDDYDLINIHNSNPSIVSKILTYLPTQKVIFTLHAPPENMTFQYYHREQYLQLLNDPNKMLLCVSKSHSERCLKALDYYNEYPQGNPRIGYILNGIYTDKYDAPRSFDCGTIGRFSPSKNVLESLKCVEAITRYTGGQGFFVGTVSNYEDSSANQKKYIDDIMKILDENPQIKWYKSLPSATIQVLLSNSKTYISLSTIETFGLTICEAIMQGTPCIGFDMNGIGEIIEEGVNGYKFSNKRSKWDIRYLESIELYKKCLNLDNNAVRENAVTRFDIKRVINDYYKLYKEFN